MILQTKASTLANLLGLEGVAAPHGNVVLDAITIAREEGHKIKLADAVSNDRTTLKHQKS